MIRLRAQLRVLWLAVALLVLACAGLAWLALHARPAPPDAVADSGMAGASAAADSDAVARQVADLSEAVTAAQATADAASSRADDAASAAADAQDRAEQAKREADDALALR